MVKIIIFEGISTCGKTTVQDLVYEHLTKSGKKCLNVGEEIVSKTFLSKDIKIELSKEKLKEVFLKHISQEYDFILFDRCHFSNIMMYNCDFKEFLDSEKLLIENNAKIIWLYFSPKTVVKRIRNSLQYREGIGFERYIKRLTSDCKSIEEEDKKIYEAYKKNIDKIDYCFKKTKLEYLKIDVSDIYDKKEYNSILPKIMKYIFR
jgi:thymidylate kinase